MLVISMLGLMGSSPVVEAQSVTPASRAADGTRGRDVSGAWLLNAAASDVVAAGDRISDTLVITLRARSVTFYQTDGSWRTYGLTGRRERHDLGSGATWTRATWDGATLRITFEDGRYVGITQTFSLDPGTHRLVVTSTPDQRRLPMSTTRLEYDPVIDRGQLHKRIDQGHEGAIIDLGRRELKPVQVFLTDPPQHARTGSAERSHQTEGPSKPT